jgi:hypothetical protein
VCWPALASEVIGHLLVQRGLDHRLGQCPQQPVRSDQRGTTRPGRAHQLRATASSSSGGAAASAAAASIFAGRSGRLSQGVASLFRDVVGSSSPAWPAGLSSWEVTKFGATERPTRPRVGSARLGMCLIAALWAAMLYRIWLQTACAAATGSAARPDGGIPVHRCQSGTYGGPVSRPRRTSRVNGCGMWIHRVSVAQA